MPEETDKLTACAEANCCAEAPESIQDRAHRLLQYADSDEDFGLLFELATGMTRAESKARDAAEREAGRREAKAFVDELRAQQESRAASGVIVVTQGDHVKVDADEWHRGSDGSLQLSRGDQGVALFAGGRWESVVREGAVEASR